jgi:uncharacterized protein YkwD
MLERVPWLLLAGTVAATAPPAPAACPRLERSEMLSALNQARAAGGHCGHRGEHRPAAPLAWSTELAETAQRQARWLAERGELVHTGPAGEPLAERARVAGYSFRRISENLALGQTTPAEVVADWLGSEGHCANLLDAAAAEVGVALACRSDGDAVWVMVAGRR